MPKGKQTKGDSASLAQLRLRIARAPQKPGIYRWLDERGNVLYIGKAKNVRKRLKTYVVAPSKTNRSPGPWKEALLKHIADFDVTVTENELEALMLETNLIKEHRPKYNVLMKDDKNYVYVKITTQLPYPSVEIVRRMEEKEAKYFGPFTSGRSVKHALDLLQTVFNYRACKRSIDALNKKHASPPHRRVMLSGVLSGAPKGRSRSTETKHEQRRFTQHDINLKPCIESQIGRCNGLCDGKISGEEYRNRIEEVMRFFKGDRSTVRAKLRAMMEGAALNKKFEQAARLRDTLRYIKSLDEQQIVSGTKGENTDAIGVAIRAGKAQTIVLQERNGKVVNELSYALSGQAENSAEILRRFLPQYYNDAADIPDTVLIGEDIEEQELLEELLQTQKGKPVSIQIPARGKKSKLLTMAQMNAAEKIERQFAAWEAAAQNIETALTELQGALGLRSKPKRIECYDISHLHGTETVGSMVVFIGGKPQSDHYRSFTIRTMRRGEIDDYRALREVLTRRLRHLKKENVRERKDEEIALEKNKKIYVIVDRGLEETYLERGFQSVRRAPKELEGKVPDGEIVMMFDLRKNKPDPSLTAKPDLIVIDGGKGQLGAGLETMKEAGIEIPCAALAKEKEEIFVPSNPNPNPIPEPARFLLMRLRDEAHRFANRHRERRRKKTLMQ